MIGHTLTGTRIRERRLSLSKKQGALAADVGISAAYLNLIEHNKRRIGGKLLTDIAEALEVDPGRLADGTDLEALASLGAAATDAPDAEAEVDQAEDFAGRFPGWARLVAAQHQQIEQLERRVQSMADRMAHDPQLADALHEILSMAAAINSTSTILSDPGEIEAEWQNRFLRNINEDSQRLARSSQDLVTYFERSGGKDSEATITDAGFANWLDARDHHIPELENAHGRDAVDQFVRQDSFLSGLQNTDASALVRRHLQRYLRDATDLPIDTFRARANELLYDPIGLSTEFGCTIETVLRRLATLPAEDGQGGFGLVTCDSAGVKLIAKSIPGFEVPQNAGFCPKWPIFQALARPMVPHRAVIQSTGRDPLKFMTYSIAVPVSKASFAGTQLLEATMLVVPSDRTQIASDTASKVGMTCRICTQPSCDHRREPSILGLSVTRE